MRDLATLAIVALAPSLTRAHLFMNSPSPIPGSAIKDPLAGDGSNFPCHGVSFPGSNGLDMPVGSTQLLSFDTGGGYNTAVHGGGSCQISVTYETDPKKIRNPANWYVILSIEGGCPTNSLANLDGSYTGPNGGYSGSRSCNDTSTNGFDCVNQFPFNIPRGLKNGQATLAWTWFNTIGNREIYMNCAAISVSGGASDFSQMQSMPQLFVANLAAPDLPSGCASSERTNIGFPNPGPVASRKAPSSRNFVASATSQYPIGTPPGCPNNARVAVSNPGTTAPSVAPTSNAYSSTPVSTTPSTSSTVDAESSGSTDVADSSSLQGSDTPASSIPPPPSTDTTQPSSAPISSPSSRATVIQTSSYAQTTTVKKTTAKRTTAKKTTTKKATPAKSCNANHVAAVKKAKGKNAVSFCKKYKAPRGSTKSSVKGVPKANQLVAACKCIIAAQATTTTKKVKTTQPKTTAPATTTPQSTPATTANGEDGDETDTGGTATTSASASTNSCPSGSVPCTRVNDVVCPDSSHYGICDNNMCAVSQAVAPGTACENGQIVAASSNSKRSLNQHLARHVRRAHGHI